MYCIYTCIHILSLSISFFLSLSPPLSLYIYTHMCIHIYIYIYTLYDLLRYAYTVQYSLLCCRVSGAVCHASRVVCRVSGVLCRVSRVVCRVSCRVTSPVTCNVMSFCVMASVLHYPMCYVCDCAVVCALY